MYVSFDDTVELWLKIVQIGCPAINQFSRVIPDRPDLSLSTYLCITYRIHPSA